MMQKHRVFGEVSDFDLVFYEVLDVVDAVLEDLCAITFADLFDGLEGQGFAFLVPIVAFWSPEWNNKSFGLARREAHASDLASFGLNIASKKILRREILHPIFQVFFGWVEEDLSVD